MNQPSLPHHRVKVWHLALELVRLVNRIRIADAEDRQQARKAASSCARNISEGAARTSRADKGRVYGIARGECGETVASVELSGAKGGTPEADVQRVVELGSRVSAMLYRLL
jgi:four helix bundle protein